jgi:hypothetical protein
MVNKKLYRKWKGEERCIMCGKMLTQDDKTLECEMCDIKQKIAGLQTQINHIQRFLDTMFKDRDTFADRLLNSIPKEKNIKRKHIDLNSPI